MSTVSDTTMIKLLASTLESFGADRTRWPVHVRRDLSSLIADHEEAQRLVAEAAALDQLLDLAPRVSLQANSALAQRIVAQTALERSSQISGRSGFSRPSDSKNNAYAGMAMAASLVLGVLAGSQQGLAPALQEVAASAGLESAASGDQAAVPGDDSFGLVSEDLL